MEIKKFINFTGPEDAVATATVDVANRTAQTLHLSDSVTQANSILMSETGSNQGDLSHDSEHSRDPDPMFGQQNGMNNGLDIANYVSPQHEKSQSKRKSTKPLMSRRCSTCGKEFRSRSQVTRHERIHSSIRPHACDFPGCGKRFVYRDGLTIHKRIHTGEKPYRCNICETSFSDPSTISRHNRYLHPGVKTSTRRTTFTGHQNLYTGTVNEAATTALAAAEAAEAAIEAVGTEAAEAAIDAVGTEAAAAVPMALAAHSGSNWRGQQRLNRGPSPNPINLSTSLELTSTNGRPFQDLGEYQYMNSLYPGEYSYMNSLHPGEYPYMNSLHPGEHPYMNSSSSLGHLQAQYHVSPTLPTTASSLNGMQPTFHPTGYSTPSILEPPANTEQLHPGTASGNPFLTSMGWQFPPQNMPSLWQSNGQVYPDPDLYYSGSVMDQHMHYQMPDEQGRN